VWGVGPNNIFYVRWARVLGENNGYLNVFFGRTYSCSAFLAVAMKSIHSGSLLAVPDALRLIGNSGWFYLLLLIGSSCMKEYLLSKK